MVAGRVLTLGDQLPANAKPFFSANDRSRWATVRALGDRGTFELDQVLASDDGRQWDSIDKVRHVGADGQLHSYSSKPPLLPVLVTGQYQVLKWSLIKCAQYVIEIRKLQKLAKLFLPCPLPGNTEMMSLSATPWMRSWEVWGREMFQVQ